MANPNLFPAKYRTTIATPQIFPVIPHTTMADPNAFPRTSHTSRADIPYIYVPGSHTTAYDEIPIEHVDIDSTISPHGWLTDTTIRHIIRQHGNFSTTSQISFVDPTWLAAWEKGGCQAPSPHPYFLTTTTSSGDRPIGLAMPFNENNGHWSVIWVNFEERGAAYFNSLLGSGIARAERVMSTFFETFAEYFVGGVRGPDFRFEIDRHCAKQSDGSSCGIYAVRNLLDLLDHRRPGSKVLSYVEKKNFRTNAVRLLEEKYVPPRVWSPSLRRQKVRFA
jgi:hypothetical protein